MAKNHAFIRKRAWGKAAAAAIALLLFILNIPMPSRAERFADHFSVWLDDSGEEVRLPVALLYSHENGIFADGILHFMPLFQFIEREYEPLTVTVTGDSVYRVEYDSRFFDTFSDSVSFYEPSEDDFVRMDSVEGNPVSLAALPPGDYLMAVNISGTKGDEYYSGAAFIHIIIPGGESSWPIQKETLMPLVLTTLTPAPVSAK